jgi:TIR domain
MPAIFVSYRREDSAGHAGRLFDRLQEHFGRGNVFWDVSGSIKPGEPFPRAIERAIDSCETLLAVIGQHWLMGTDATGRRRLEAPDDYVRLELARALQRNIQVIPVLVQHAAMPRAEDLPQDLQPLALHQAIELSDNRWDVGVAELIDAIPSIPPIPPPPPPPRLPWWTKAAVACVLLIAVGFGVWVIWLKSGPHPPPPLPDYLYGKWKGETPGLLFPRTIELSISPDEYLLTSSTVSGSCIGRLEVLNQDENSVKFKEHTTKANCRPADEVILSKADSLTLNFSSREAIGTISGKLYKVKE